MNEERECDFLRKNLLNGIKTNTKPILTPDDDGE